MPSKTRTSPQALLSFIRQSKSRRDTILLGQGEPGHRAVPAQGGNHDARIGSRIDVGDIIKKDGKNFRRYKFQLNKNAQDSTIRKLAAEDSHKVYSTADVEIKANRTDMEAQEAIEDFADQMSQNLSE